MAPHLVLIAPRFRDIDQFTTDPASTSTNVTGTSSCLISVCFDNMIIFVDYWDDSSFHTRVYLILVLVKFGGFRKYSELLFCLSSQIHGN